MSIEYTWEITHLEAAPVENNLTDVIKSVHWKYHADDGKNKATMAGSFGVSPPNQQSFIPYENLTKEDIISWLDSHIERDEMRQSLRSQLALINNPPTVIRKLPWS